LSRKGQGAVEYLLILAVVLIVVASAVYYITRVGGGPIIQARAELRAGENVFLVVTSGSVADWEYAAFSSAGQVVDWTPGPEPIDPGDEILLSALTPAVDAGDLGVGDKVKIMSAGSVICEVDIQQG